MSLKKSKNKMIQKIKNIFFEKNEKKKGNYNYNLGA